MISGQDDNATSIESKESMSMILDRWIATNVFHQAIHIAILIYLQCVIKKLIYFQGHDEIKFRN